MVNTKESVPIVLKQSLLPKSSDLLNEGFKTPLIQYQLLLLSTGLPLKGVTLKLLLFILFSLIIDPLWGVDATLKIETDVEKRTRIAVVDSSSLQNQQLFKIFVSDLKISGHFILDKKHHSSPVMDENVPSSFKSQEYILKYSVSGYGSAKLVIVLLRASDGMVVLKKSYAVGSKSKISFLVHKAVTDVNRVLQYPDISWINRYVVYAVYSSPGRSEIRLADYTMHYQKTIIKGGLNLFPKWADSQQRTLYYTSYKERIPTLYRLNIYNGQKEKITSSEGMLVCSDVSRDGSKILLTMAPYGQADIYELDVATKTKRAVTHFGGIDVNGRYSENERSIVFVSNRLGYPNIFKKSITSPATSQVVYHGRNNNGCDAYQDKIVYSSRESNNAFRPNSFNLYLTSLKRGDTRAITTLGSNQFPRFSKDGNVILYLKQKERSSSIGYINVESAQSLLFPFSEQRVQSLDW